MREVKEDGRVKITKAQKEWLQYLDVAGGRTLAGGVPAVVKRLIRRELAALNRFTFDYVVVELSASGRRALSASKVQR